jgi:membrane fusion protein, multidrug efflux system
MTGRTLRRLWLPLVVLCALVALAVVRVMQATAEREPVQTVEQIRQERGVPVAVAAVEQGALEVWRELSGTVSGVQESVVRARSGDRIVSVPVTVGQRVRRGQVLVEQAGETSEARARQAETARRQAERYVDRMRPLHEAGAISDQEWETATTQLELAEADLAAARDPLVLTSPLAGVVTNVPARPGMIPDSGDPLVRIADLSRFVVYLRASAAQAEELRQGQLARLATRAIEGRVRRVALQADPETRLVEVEVEFPADARLILGTLARVEVQVAGRRDALSIPRDAVRDGTAWVVGDDRRATRRTLTLGLETRDRVEVLDGLAPGERVVIEGASRLSDGALVRLPGDDAGVAE